MLFEKRTSSRGAGFVHGEIHNYAVVHRNELRVLAANFEDRVHSANLRGRAISHQFFVNVHSSRFVSRNFVVHRIRTDQLANQFAPGAGRSDSTNRDSWPKHALDFLHPFMNHFNGPPGGSEVNLVQQSAGFVENREVRAYRADIDSKIRGNFFARIDHRLDPRGFGMVT